MLPTKFQVNLPVTVFSENFHHEISFSTAVTLKIRLRTPKSNHFFYVPIIYPLKFGKNRTTASQDIVQTRKCHANANGIDTKSNMSPLL